MEKYETAIDFYNQSLAVNKQINNDKCYKYIFSVNESLA